MASALTKYASSDTADNLAALINELDAAKERLEPLIKDARAAFETENANKFGVHETGSGSLVYSEVNRTAWADLVATAKALGLTQVIKESVDATAAAKVKGNAEWTAAIIAATGPGGTKIDLK